MVVLFRGDFFCAFLLPKCCLQKQFGMLAICREFRRPQHGAEDPISAEPSAIKIKDMAHFNKRGDRRNGHKANYQSRQRGTVNAHSVESANIQQQATATTTTKHRRNIDDNQTVCRLMRSMFDRLPRELQKLETKQSCIAAVVDRHNDKVGDLGDFYGWLLKRAEEIRRTYDFKDVCESKGLSSDEEQQAVSEHLVLEPKAVINKIRMEGLVTYQGNIKMFRDRLVPEAYRYDKNVKEGGDE